MIYTVDRATATYILREHYGVTVKPYERRAELAAMLMRENNAAGRGWNQAINVTPNP